MKNFLALAVLCTSLSSTAAIVNGARLDAAGKNVILTLTYGGGCRDHKFTLKKGDFCLESYPMQCGAEVIETVVNGPDICEAIITKEVKFSIKRNRLSSATYWTFTGDIDQTGRESRATVLIPIPAQ